MTTTLAEPSGDTVATAILLDPAADGARLDELLHRNDVTVIDRRESLAAEVAELRPALSAAELADSDVWAWFPWRRTLVALPGRRPFRRLRLDRNRNKITQPEQDAFERLTIGVIGLSVGHAIAHTLAQEGLCGRLRLADFDSIELSNLNRIPATVLDLGVNKAVVVARRIAELDPYLDTTVFPTGLTEENIQAFFEGLDLVVEECDSLDIKLRVRAEARKRGIPVLMETSDRGLFDVERFDDEPDRQLFHGLLGDIDPASLEGLSTTDKAPHVMRILQTGQLSPRMAASMAEINHTVSTWPQLAGDVQLGGATVAAAVRRFGRGEPLQSGRIRIDLDAQLDELDGSAEADTTAAVDAVVVDPTEQLPGNPLDAVIHAIQLAPSGGNIQPWAVEVTPDAVDIALVPERTSALDVKFRGSYMAIGAAAFNARVAAAHFGLQSRVSVFPFGVEDGPVARVHCAPGAQPELAALYTGMVRRITNRNLGSGRTLDGYAVQSLQHQVTAAGARLHLLTDAAQVTQIAGILAQSDRIRFLTPLLHSQMMNEMRWPSADRAALGIDVHALGLDAADLAKLEVSSRSDVMAHLANWRGGNALGDSTRDRVGGSSAVAVVTVDGDTPGDYVRGGMALEQFWIAAEQFQLAVHPVSPVFLYARNANELAELSSEFREDLRSLQQFFNSVAGIGDNEAPILILRLSYDAPPPAVRSQRLDRDDVVRPSASNRQDAPSASTPQQR
jgi:ThiF family